MRQVLAFLVMAACGSSQGPDALASEARCRQAVDKLAKLATVTNPPPADLLDREVQKCTKKYTNAIVDCIVAAKDLGTAQVCYKSDRPKTNDGDAAALQVKQAAFEAYPSWQAQHAEKVCPALADLAPFLAGNKTTDPWGHELRISCGSGSPVPFGIASSGPDGTPDTADDIKSW